MEDLCDHGTRDTAICEARLAVRRPSLKKILNLNDENFRRFVQNGCRWPDENQDIDAELARLKYELVELRSLILSRCVD